MRRPRPLGSLALAVLATCLACQSATPDAEPRPQQDSLSVDVAEIRALLPQLPADFHWEMFEDGAMWIPCPDHWFRGETVLADTYTGSVSAEDWGELGYFKTGFTVQLVRRVDERSGKPASLFAKAQAQAWLDRADSELVASTIYDEGFDPMHFYISLRIEPENAAPFMVHKVFISEEPGDRLYIFSFESPLAVWEQNLADYGNPIMGLIQRPHFQ